MGIILAHHEECDDMNTYYVHSVHACLSDSAIAIACHRPQVLVPLHDLNKCMDSYYYCYIGCTV